MSKSFKNKIEIDEYVTDFKKILYTHILSDSYYEEFLKISDIHIDLSFFEENNIVLMHVPVTLHFYNGHKLQLYSKSYENMINCLTDFKYIYRIYDGKVQGVLKSTIYELEDSLR